MSVGFSNTYWAIHGLNHVRAQPLPTLRLGWTDSFKGPVSNQTRQRVPDVSEEKTGLGNPQPTSQSRAFQERTGLAQHVVRSIPGTHGTPHTWWKEAWSRGPCFTLNNTNQTYIKYARISWGPRNRTRSCYDTNHPSMIHITATVTASLTCVELETCRPKKIFFVPFCGFRDLGAQYFWHWSKTFHFPLSKTSICNPSEIQVELAVLQSQELSPR